MPFMVTRFIFSIMQLGIARTFQPAAAIRVLKKFETAYIHVASSTDCFNAYELWKSLIIIPCYNGE